jgi:glycosyltransferase involved in cell wall biosynthesis
LDIVGPREVQEPLPPGVVLHGRIDRSTPEGEQEYLDVYRRATAFVLPSLYEPFGIVFLEAMAWGLPCVVANRCAMPEIVDDGTTGRVVDPTDRDALAGALLELTDPAVAHRMGGAARRRMEERFTWDAVAERMLAELEARIPTAR